MRHAIPLLLAAATSLAPAQNAVLPIDDLLLEPAPRDAYLEGVRTHSLSGARRFLGEQSLGGLTGAQERPFRDEGTRGHFAGDQLTALLQALGLQHPMAIRGRSLVLPAGGGDEVRKVLGELRQRLPRPLAVDVLLKRTAAGTTETLLARSVEAMPGRLCVVGEVQRRAAVLEYEVEIAQASSIANPAVGEVRSGVMVALRPQVLPTGEAALLEVVARHVVDASDQRVDTGCAGIGPLDRAALRIAEVGRVLRVSPGTTVVQRWSAADADYELTLRAIWQLPAPVRPAGHDLAVFSLRGDGRGFRSIAVQPDAHETWNDDEDEASDPWRNPGEIAGGEAAWLDGGGDDDDRGPDWRTTVAMGQAMWSLQVAAQAWFDRLHAGPTLELRWFDAAADAAWPADGAPPAGSRPIGGARLDLVDGAWAATTLRDEYLRVHDWDAEVAQASRIADPKCRRQDHGLWFNVRSLGDQIEVEGALSRQLDVGLQQLALSQPLFAPEMHKAQTTGAGANKSAQLSSSPAVALPADAVTVEHPRIVTTSVQLRRTLTAGQTVVHRSSAHHLLGVGRELVLVASRPK
jgi:hypothetical protein